MNQPGFAANPFDILGQRLLADPIQTLDGILTGRVALGAMQRADSADLLDDLLAQDFWSEADRQRLTVNLDSALLHWLRDRIAWSPGQVLSQGARAHIALLDTALVIAGRLLLPQTATALAGEQAWWEDHLAVLRWPGELDVLVSFDTALALRQADWRFAPRWFAACEDAAWGAPGWQATLDTALLGLRRLPCPAEGIPELSVALGLGRFATRALERGHGEAERLFRRKAASLSVLYPRGEEHWRGVWNEVLGDLPKSPRRAAADELRGWLDRALPALNLTAPPGKEGKKGRLPRAERPHPDEREDLIRRMKAASRMEAPLWSRFKSYLDRDWIAADADGEYYYAVRSVHNLGERLLKLGPDADQLAQIHAWTLRALNAEPASAYIWGLWAEILAALGHADHVLAVRWETVRRFPEDPIPRNELAEVLRRRSQSALAEALLRRTMADFPRNVVCRVALAELLRERGEAGEAEAEALLRRTMADFSHNVVCRIALVDLLLGQGRLEEAEPVWREANALAPGDPYVKNLGQRLAAGGTQAAESMPARPVQRTDGMSVARLPEAEMAGLDPPVADFLNWLGRRRGQWEGYFGGVPIPEVAAEGDALALALAALRDGEARPEVEQWLRARPSDVALKLASIAPEGDGVLAGLLRAFPALAGRLNWLCLASLEPDRRQALMDAEQGRLRQARDAAADNPAEWWGGRLAAVYPGLGIDDAALRVAPEAWQRLRADLALASIDLAIPAIA